MAWLLFLDESGHDRKQAPYEVLAGIAIRDRDIWRLVGAMNDAERLHFGRCLPLPPRSLPQEQPRV